MEGMSTVPRNLGGATYTDPYPEWPDPPVPVVIATLTSDQRLPTIPGLTATPSWGNRTVLKSIVLYAALITLGVVLSPILEPSSAPAQVSAFKRTILQRADVPGTNLELIIATVDIAPPPGPAGTRIPA